MEAAVPLDAPDSDGLNPMISEQSPMPSGTGINEKVWYINNVHLSQLHEQILAEETEAVVAHYVRDESRKLWRSLEATTLVDKQFVILNVKGDPGSGKSLTCFGWASYQKTVRKAKICFITESWSSYRYTTLDDTNTHRKIVYGTSMSPFDDIVLETSADIYVVDNFIGPYRTPHNPTLALHSIVDALKAKQKKVTIILCSSIQCQHPNMSPFTSELYSLQSHFMRGWTVNEIIASWYVSKTLRVPILPQELVDDQEKFAARLRVSCGNMYYMHAENTKNVAQNQNYIMESRLCFCFTGSDHTYGLPGQFHWAFVHVSEAEVRLLNEYTEELMCERIRSCRRYIEQMLTLFAYTSSPKWRYDVFMRFVFEYAKDTNMQLTFHKTSQFWTMFRKPLKICVHRIVKYEPILTNLSEWYIAPNECTVFLPGNSGQDLFDSVYVQRDLQNVYHVYFFRVAYGAPRRFLFAHGGVFLATLFPAFLCQDEDGAKAAWVEMKVAADKRQREIDALVEQKLCEERHRCASMIESEPTDIAECLGMGFYESLLPVFPPAHLINRPTKVKLHCYIVTGKDSLVKISRCKMYDVDCMSRFDESFTKDKVRVAHMASIR